jgi:hypothetical protein
MVLEDIKDNSGKAQSQQDNNKRLGAEDNPKKVFKPEGDQGYASVLPTEGQRSSRKSLRIYRKS